MLIIILALVLSAEYCNGQRRWAGSYSGTYAPEDKMTWDNRNYPSRDIEASTEANIRYRGRWPADTRKGEGAPDISLSRESTPRGTLQSSRRDDKSRAETSQGDKRIYQTSPEERHIQPADYSTRKNDRSAVVDERDSRLKEKVSRVDDSYDTRQNTRNYRGDVGEASEELPQRRNQQRPLSLPSDHHGSRREEDRNFKGYPLAKIAPHDLTRPPVHDYARSRDESQNPRQERDKDGRDATHGKIPQDRREEQYHPKEDYDDKQTEHGAPPGRYRPTDNEGKLTAREHIRPESQPKAVVHRDSAEDDYQDEAVRKEVYGIEVSYTGRYNRSQIDPETGNERFISTYSKGHANNDGNDEDRIRAREYDRRREEELKRREYDRRFKEEMKRRQEEARNLRVEEDGRKDAGIHESENRREEGRGMRHRLDEDVQIAESERHQGHSSGSKYGTKRTDDRANERNFSTRDIGRLKETHTEEKNYRGEDEEQIKSPDYVRRVDESRHENVKGDLNRGDRIADRREIARNREQTRVQDDRIEGHNYNRKAKGEAINRELDHTVKLVNHNPSSQSGVHKKSGRRTTDSTVNGEDIHQIATTESGYHSRQDNRAREHSVDRTNIQGNERSQERGTHSTSERGGTVPHQRAISIRNSEDSANREFRHTFLPPSSDTKDRQGRRTHPSRQESTSAAPSYDGRTRQKTDNVGSVIRHNRPADRTGPVSTHLSVKTERSSMEQPIRNDNSQRQRPADNWKTVNNPRNVNGYHRNVSYDTIVVLDDESDDETDVWNIPSQQDKEQNRAINLRQGEYKRGSTDSISNTRDSRRSLPSGSTELRRRNKRAPVDNAFRETAIQAEQSRIDEVDDIHPDVEILPGYAVAKPFAQRNDNDEVLDGEVEIFSETEIRVSAKDYKMYGAIILNKNAANESQSTNSGTSAKGS